MAVLGKTEAAIPPMPFAAEQPSHGRLVVAPEKCTGCCLCELVCSLRNYGEVNPVRARIHVVRSQTDEGVIVTMPVVCLQCEKPLCMEMCPAGALSRHPVTHAVVCDGDRCLGCRTCVEVCPYGAPSVDPRTGHCEKCDLCDGDPVCVKVCTQGAIKFLPSEEESIARRCDMAERYVTQLRMSTEPTRDPE